MVMNPHNPDSTSYEIQSTLDEITSLLRRQDEFETLNKRLNIMLNNFREENSMSRQLFLITLEEGGNPVDESFLRLKFVQSRGQRSKVRESQRYKSIFSTTTTATGLPTEEPQPNPKLYRPLRLSNSISRSQIGNITRSTSPGLYSNRADRRLTCPDLSFSLPCFARAKQASTSIQELNDSLVPIVANRSTSPKKRDSPANSQQPVFGRSSSVPPENQSTRTTSGCSEVASSVQPPLKEHPELTISFVDDKKSDDIEKRESLIPPNTLLLLNNYDEELRNEYKEGLNHFKDYQGIMLQSLTSWNFPMFELAYRTDAVLSQIAFKIFRNMGIFETFKLGQHEFVNFMMALEQGYRKIPYHNRIHAADVLHGCWYLTTQEISGFRHASTIFSSDSSDSENTDPITGNNTISVSEETDRKYKSSGGSLSQVIPALELMALYLAAAMHDYDHPGRTNAFLVTTCHPLALLYNDRSVLENHHSSAAWRLFHSDKKFNFLKSLETAEWKRLRFLVIEAILATDLKKHFEIQTEFASKATRRNSSCGSDADTGTANSANNSTCFDWNSNEDRLLVSKMVIKLADIGGPAKQKRLHVTWTKAICQEFFEQGDEERTLGLPVSRHMDRNTPEVASLQCDFINHLIEPMISTMDRAGLLAGSTGSESIVGMLCEEDEENSSEDPIHVTVCSLLEQLKRNLNYWKNKPKVVGEAAITQMKEAFNIAYPIILTRTDADRVDADAFSPLQEDREEEDEKTSVTPS